MRKPYDPTRPFQNFADASRTTGISQFALRQGCRSGTLPYIRCGTTYLLNMKLLMERLDEMSQDMSQDKNVIVAQNDRGRPAQKRE